jgi:hypothetical protein
VLCQARFAFVQDIIELRKKLKKLPNLYCCKVLFEAVRGMSNSLVNFLHFGPASWRDHDFDLPTIGLVRGNLPNDETLFFKEAQPLADITLGSAGFVANLARSQSAALTEDFENFATGGGESHRLEDKAVSDAFEARCGEDNWLGDKRLGFGNHVRKLIYERLVYP